MKYIEPYKTCSLFGTLRYFMNIQESVFLIHGPSGCAFFNRSSALTLNGFCEPLYDVESPLVFCTDFEENDAIFGGVQKVENAIDEIRNTINPQVIFVFNCCVSEVIGEDIDKVCNDCQKKYGIKCIPVHSGGFKGDHKYGMRMAGEIIVDSLISNPQNKKMNRVNLIGDFDYFCRGSKGVYEDLTLLGIKDICIFPGKCNIEDIENMAMAQLNIVFCQNAARHFAEKMKQKYGIYYIGKDNGCFGIEKCLNLYLEVCSQLSLDSREVLDKYELTKKEVCKYKEILHGTNAVIVAGMHRASGYAEMLNELGVKVEYIYSECDKQYFDNEYFSRYTDRYRCNDAPIDLRGLIRNIKPTFVFSTLPDLIAPIGYLHQGMIDFTGFSGIVKFARYLTNAKEYGYDRAYYLLKEEEK